MSGLTVKEAIKLYSSQSIPSKKKELPVLELSQKKSVDFLVTQFGFLCIRCGKLTKTKKGINNHSKICALDHLSHLIDNI